MSNPGTPLILYVPGLLPKPDPVLHREALLRCLLTGIRRVDDSLGDEIAAAPGCFEIVPWTFDFYGRHRNFELDRAAIEELLLRDKAVGKDLAEADSWSRRFTRWLYHLGDRLPFLIPHLASEPMEVHLHDLRRYTLNQRGIAERMRHKLKQPLRQAKVDERPVLLIGHSMGSVIAFDALWQMSHRDNEDVYVDVLLTMGSPLGQHYIQSRLKGAGEVENRRYPDSIRCWKNLSAVGDLTAIDPRLGNDYGRMVDLGILESIEDTRIFTWYRLDGDLNVHSEYGYLVHEVTARIVSEWWRSFS